jgi:hypothetical protein
LDADHLATVAQTHLGLKSIESVADVSDMSGIHHEPVKMPVRDENTSGTHGRNPASARFAQGLL